MTAATGARAPSRRGDVLPEGLPAAAATRRRPTWPATVATAVVGSLPLVLMALSLVVGGGPRTVSADDALLTIGARDALHGGVLIGPYSRFGWHHPGPSYLYILALPTWLWHSPTGTWVAASVLSSACAVATVVLVRRAGGAIAGWIAAAAMLLLVAGLGPGTFRDPWNPYSVTLPVLLSIAAAALGAAGVPGALAWAAVAGTGAVQTHVSTAPVVLGLFALALVVRAVGWVGRRIRRRGARAGAGAGEVVPDALPAVEMRRSRRFWRRRPDVCVAAVLLVLEWWPPLWDEAFGSGNLSTLVQFFTAHHPLHGWAPSWRLVTAVAGITLFQHHGAFHDGISDPDPLRTTVVFCSLAAVAVGAGVIRRRPVAVWLGLAGVVGGALAVESVTRVVGPTLRYLVLWMAVLPVLPAIGVAAALGRAPGRPARAGRRHPTGAAAVAVPVAAVVVLASVLAVRAVDATRPAVDESDPDVATAYGLVAPAVGPGHTTVRIEITDGGRWPAAAGVALELVRAGHRVRVQRPWTTVFGDGRLATGREAVAIIVAGVNPGTWPPPAQATPLGEAGPEYLFVRRFGPGCGLGALPFGGPACPPPVPPQGPVALPGP